MGVEKTVRSIEAHPGIRENAATYVKKQLLTLELSREHGPYGGASGHSCRPEIRAGKERQLCGCIFICHRRIRAYLSSLFPSNDQIVAPRPAKAGNTHASCQG